MHKLEPQKPRIRLNFVKKKLFAASMSVTDLPVCPGIAGTGCGWAIQDKKEAKIHVTFMGRELQPERLEVRRIAASAAAIVGFRPTGGRPAS